MGEWTGDGFWVDDDDDDGEGDYDDDDDDDDDDDGEGASEVNDWMSEIRVGGFMS